MIEENHLCYKGAKNLSEWQSCPNVVWKVELVSNKTGDVAEEISKPTIEGIA